MPGLFTVRNSLLTISCIGTLLLVWLTAGFWLSANSQRTDADRLLKSTELEDLLLDAAKEWAAERGVTYAALKSPHAVEPERRRLIDEHRRLADSTFETALEGLRQADREADLSGAIAEIDARYRNVELLRRQVHDELAQAKPARDSEVIASWFPTITNLIMASDTLRVRARYQANTTVRDIEALRDLKHAVGVMSEYADRESALIAGTIAADDPLVLADVEYLSVFRGHIKQAWETVDTYARDAQAVPEVVAAIQRVREEFLDAFVAIRVPIILAGMEGSEYPVTSDEWIAEADAAINPVRELGTVASAISRALTSERKANGERRLIIATIILAAGLAIAAVSIWIVVALIVRPLDRITRAMTALAGGDETVSVPSTNVHGEIGTMARAVQVFKESADERARQISEGNLRLQALNEELEDRVKQRTAELAAARDEEIQANRAKSQFLANMSHELRTPMNAIIGFTRLVMRRAKEALPLKQYQNLEKILISAEHLLGLVNDILDLSKIEAGQMDVRPSDVELEPLVAECLRTVEPMVESERVRLNMEIETGLPLVFMDRDKLKQVLVNLLSNAVKFTEQGTITIAVSRHDGGVRLAVADTGIGIPEDKLEPIFEEFHQVDSSSTRQYGGTGLGLAITRRLTHLIGGEISVESELGKGSTFSVVLPLRYSGPRAAAPVAASGVLEDQTVRPAAGTLVLAIDDDPNAIYLLQENLAEAGYQVIGATDGEEGVKKARELKPFAITLDIRMPNMDGWQVLHELKADEATRDIPVIALTIVDQKDLGYRLGAFDYLLKPFDSDAILSTLARIPPSQGRLLVVDDDPNVADMVRQFLDGEPYEIEVAMDGLEAIEAIDRRRPDIILLDLLMPRLDGFGVFEHLQQHPEHCDIPVIVLTAKTLTREEEALLEERVQTVIQKQGLERAAILREIRAALPQFGGRKRSG